MSVYFNVGVYFNVSVHFYVGVHFNAFILMYVCAFHYSYFGICMYDFNASVLVLFIVSFIQGMCVFQCCFAIYY